MNHLGNIIINLKYLPPSIQTLPRLVENIVIHLSTCLDGRLLA